MANARPAGNRRKSSGGRKVSFGRGGAKSAKAAAASGAAALAAAHERLLAISNGGKLSSKDVWSIDLGGSMDAVFSTEASTTATVDENGEPIVTRTFGNQEAPPVLFNFMRASCTLDASVKVYGCRVDDALTSSYRVLEAISSSNDASKHTKDGDDADEAEGEKRVKVRRGRSGAATLAPVGSIDLADGALRTAPDAVFASLSRVFDEGGARGLLLRWLGTGEGAEMLFRAASVEVRASGKGHDVDAVAALQGREPAATGPQLLRGLRESRGAVALGGEALSEAFVSALGGRALDAEDGSAPAVCDGLGSLYEQLEEAGRALRAVAGPDGEPAGTAAEGSEADLTGRERAKKSRKQAAVAAAAAEEGGGGGGAEAEEASGLGGSASDPLGFDDLDFGVWDDGFEDGCGGAAGPWGEGDGEGVLAGGATPGRPAGQLRWLTTGKKARPLRAASAGSAGAGAGAGSGSPARGQESDEDSMGDLRWQCEDMGYDDGGDGGDFDDGGRDGGYDGGLDSGVGAADAARDLEAVFSAAHTDHDRGHGHFGEPAGQPEAGEGGSVGYAGMAGGARLRAAAAAMRRGGCSLGARLWRAAAAKRSADAAGPGSAPAAKRTAGGSGTSAPPSSVLDLSTPAPEPSDPRLSLASRASAVRSSAAARKRQAKAFASSGDSANQLEPGAATSPGAWALGSLLSRPGWRVHGGGAAEAAAMPPEDATAPAGTAYAPAEPAAGPGSGWWSSAEQDDGGADGFAYDEAESSADGFANTQATGAQGLGAPAFAVGAVTVGADGSIVDGALSGVAGLEAAARRVGKTDVGHASTAKRVDVAALKQSVWSAIERLPRSAMGRFGFETAAAATGRSTRGGERDDGDAAGEALVAAVAAGEAVGNSFASVVQAVRGDAQAGATVPFFFITLLHLANEHGVEITGRPGLEDVGVIVPN